MKIVRVDSRVDDITYGSVEPEGIRLHRGSPFVAWEPTETVVAWDQARLLAPVIPTKIIAVGRNYVDHAEELDNPIPETPLIFLKPPTAVIGPLQSIRIPADSENVHHEAELAVVIGKVARDVKIEDAGAYILGYTAANDVTARDLQRGDGQWTRAKGFDKSWQRDRL
ncbi:MAG: fumarylacetoacetate hydrolase family protein [Actinomycetota bacterium]|nr:fumarylacetoacetate hydrolase family protein [Actinomycetota bacterium]